MLTNEGNDPRPEGRDERRVEGKDWAMAAKPEGRPRAVMELEETGDEAGELGWETGDEAGELGWERAYQGG